MQNRYKTVLGLISIMALFTAGCAQQPAQITDPQPPPTEPAVQTAPGVEPASASAESADQPAAAADAAPATTADPNAHAAAAPTTDTTAPSAAPDTAPAAAATTPPTETASAAPAPTPSDENKKRQELAAKLLAMPPQDITKTIQMMTKHPRAQWLSGTGQYGYYVGGEFNAEYNPGKKLFVIKSDPAQGNTVSCEYNANGELVNNNKGDQNMKAECNGLVSKLSGYLSN